MFKYLFEKKKCFLSFVDISQLQNQLSLKILKENMFKYMKKQLNLDKYISFT